jgi:hypothetical protein
MDENEEIDTGNYRMVTTKGNSVIIMNPINIMSKKEALLFAAWLVVIAENEDNEFTKILTAVQNC